IDVSRELDRLLAKQRVEIVFDGLVRRSVTHQGKTRDGHDVVRRFDECVAESWDLAGVRAGESPPNREELAVIAAPGSRSQFPAKLDLALEEIPEYTGDVEFNGLVRRFQVEGVAFAVHGAT